MPATLTQKMTLEEFLDLPDRGNIHSIRAIAVLSNLPAHIAERELKVLKRKLDLDSDSLHIEEARAVLARHRFVPLHTSDLFVTVVRGAMAVAHPVLSGGSGDRR